MSNDSAKRLLRYLRYEARDCGAEFCFDTVLWESGVVAHEKTRAGQQASELWPFGFDEANQAIQQLAERGKISLIENEAGKTAGIKLEDKIKNTNRIKINISINSSIISIAALIIAIIALIAALT